MKRFIGTFTAFLCAPLLPMDLPSDVGVLLTNPAAAAAHTHPVPWLRTQAGCLVHFRRIPSQFTRDEECMCCAHFRGIVLRCLFLCIKQILGTQAVSSPRSLLLQSSFYSTANIVVHVEHFKSTLKGQTLPMVKTFQHPGDCGFHILTSLA